MKKIIFIVPVFFALVLIATGCGSSGDTKTVTEDTVKKDTIDRNSENFSSPH